MRGAGCALTPAPPLWRSRRATLSICGPHPDRLPRVGYPENVLAADEQVVLHRHPHWKRLIGPVLILLIVTAIAAFGMGYVNSLNWDSSPKRFVLIVLRAIWLVILQCLTVSPFLIYSPT